MPIIDLNLGEVKVAPELEREFLRELVELIEEYKEKG